MNAEERDNILTTLDLSGAFAHGATLDRQELLAQFGVYPMTDEQLATLTPRAIRKALDDEKLKEVNVVDLVRTYLLKSGRYFDTSRGVYRVALPSENAAIAERYLVQSRRKSKRASLLIAHIPTENLSQSLASRAAVADEFISRQTKRLSH